MVEIVIIILTIYGICTSFAIYKTLDRINYLELIFRNMHAQLGTFTVYCEQVLNTKRYANEPMIIGFVGQMKELYTYLKSVEDFYTFDIELSNDNISIENLDEQEERKQA